MLKRLSWPVAALLCSLPFSAPAQSQTDPQLIYELLNRLEQLERELRQLRGDFDVYQYRQQGGAANDEQLQALERRLQALESRMGFSTDNTDTIGYYEQPATPEPASVADATPAPQIEPEPAPLAAPPAPQPLQPAPPEPATVAQFPVVGDTQTAPPSGAPGVDEQTLYNTAFADLQAGQYQQAVTGFQTFLATYPNSPQAGNAQYWLGESYYVTRNFDQAKQTFLSLGARYPRSEKLPDAMLKLGYIYEALGDTNKARQIYQKLIQVYPEHRSAKTAVQRLRTL